MLNLPPCEILPLVKFRKRWYRCRSAKRLADFYQSSSAAPGRRDSAVDGHRLRERPHRLSQSARQPDDGRGYRPCLLPGTWRTLKRDLPTWNLRSERRSTGHGQVDDPGGDAMSERTYKQAFVISVSHLRGVGWRACLLSSGDAATLQPRERQLQSCGGQRTRGQGSRSARQRLRTSRCIWHSRLRCNCPRSGCRPSE